MSAPDNKYIFPFTSKYPPISTVNAFPKKYELTSRNFRTDKEGELPSSIDFRKMLHNNSYNLEAMSPEYIFQIRIVEYLCQTLAGMTRAALLGANLDSKFWYDAMLRAVCIKNRPPHSRLTNKMNPFEAWIKKRPDLSHLHVLGTSIHTKKPGIK